MLVKRSIELEDDYLCSKRGQRPRAWLIVWRVNHIRVRIGGKYRMRRVKRRGVEVIEGTSMRHVREQVARFARRRDVKLIA